MPFAQVSTTQEDHSSRIEIDTDVLIEDTDQEECALLLRLAQPNSPDTTEWSHYDLGDASSVAVEINNSGTQDF